MSRGKTQRTSLANDKQLSVHVPLTFRRRGGRREVVSPDGQPVRAPSRPQVDSTLVKAIARAFRWQRLLDTGAYATIDELAGAEKIGSTYVSRVLRLTLLAPQVVEAILKGKAEKLTLPELLDGVSVDWEKQGSEFP